MEMIKKLICIILLIVVIVANVQICYADGNYDISAFSKNSNINSISVVNDNQSSALNTAYNNGYRSIISRYSNQLINVVISDINIRFEFDYNYSSLPNTNDINSIRDFAINYISNSFENGFYKLGVNSLDFTDLNYNNFNFGFESVNLNTSQSQVEIHFGFSGSFSFKMPLKNYQLSAENQGSALNWTSLCLDLLCDTIYVNSKTFTLKSIYYNQFAYRIFYNLNDSLNNVDCVYLFHEITTLCKQNNSIDLAYTNNNRSYINDTIYDTTASNQPISRFSYYINMLDNSRIQNINYYCSNTRGWTSTSYNSANDYDICIQFAIFTPLYFNNNSNYIQSDSNGNVTPLQLTYYDCEWYEIHLQLANAFIFMITEFPLISDITNLIYSLFTMIKASFDVLLNFNGFGILFAFGMFAIVFAFIYKLIVGD